MDYNRQKEMNKIGSFAKRKGQHDKSKRKKSCNSA